MVSSCKATQNFVCMVNPKKCEYEKDVHVETQASNSFQWPLERVFPGPYVSYVLDLLMFLTCLSVSGLDVTLSFKGGAWSFHKVLEPYSALFKWVTGVSLLWNHGFHTTESLHREPHQEADASAPFSLQVGLDVLEPIATVGGISTTVKTSKMTSLGCSGALCIFPNRTPPSCLQFLNT